MKAKANRWTDSPYWSNWTCATCQAEHQDPDTLDVTSCANGHTNYLEPPGEKEKHRRAFKTAKERRAVLNEEKVMRAMMSEAFKVANRKAKP